MARILYLVHRLPYPPNKGDKVRSFHLLQALAARHEVHLGTFVDDADDLRHVDTVRQWCADIYAPRLRPAWSRLASLRALTDGTSMTEAYYAHRGLRRWVRDKCETVRPAATVAFSSSMAQYAVASGVPIVMDLVDLDSEKWAEYAQTRPFPWSWVFAREARMLLQVEKDVVRRAAFSSFVTDREAALFRRRAGTDAGAVHVVRNGIDTEYFDPDHDLANPYPDGVASVVFTGAMDYEPNVDAVRWFCSHVWPSLAAGRPERRLYIVGRRPKRSVRRLAGAQVFVTGTVDDIRPYLHHACVAVAPMRLARGIHNKILEAMAMARPVVVTPQAAQALEPALRACVVTAEDDADFVRKVDHLLHRPHEAHALGRRAREAAGACNWPARMADIEQQVTVLAGSALA